LVFKEVGTICDSMDALFIGRKKAAGTSARPPLFGNTVFYHQEAVDAFVHSCDGEDRHSNANAEASFFWFFLLVLIIAYYN
jgi:hypothetical protein